MTNTDAERVSDIVVIERLKALEMLQRGPYSKATIALAIDIIEAQSKALAEAREYATRLLVSFVTEHCNPVPEWAPLPDLMGVLTQLDNATTITRDMKAARADIAEEALKPFAEFVPDFFDDGYQDDDIVSVTSHHGGLDLTLTVGDFRRARAATTPTPENPNG